MTEDDKTNSQPENVEPKSSGLDTSSSTKNALCSGGNSLANANTPNVSSNTSV